MSKCAYKYGKHILVKDKRDSHPSSKVIGCLCVCIYMSVCVYLCISVRCLFPDSSETAKPNELKF